MWNSCLPPPAFPCHGHAVGCAMVLPVVRMSGEAPLKTHLAVKVPKSHFFLLRECEVSKQFPQGSLGLCEMHRFFTTWHVLCLLDWKTYLVLKVWWTRMYFEIAQEGDECLQQTLVWDNKV